MSFSPQWLIASITGNSDWRYAFWQARKPPASITNSINSNVNRGLPHAKHPGSLAPSGQSGRVGQCKGAKGRKTPFGLFVFPAPKTSSNARLMRRWHSMVRNIQLIRSIGKCPIIQYGGCEPERNKHDPYIPAISGYFRVVHSAQSLVGPPLTPWHNLTKHFPPLKLILEYFSYLAACLWIALRSPEPVGNAVPVRRTGSPYGVNRLGCRINATIGVQSGCSP